MLVQKTSVTKTLVQEAANQLTAISRRAETYRSEMNKLASQLPEYSVVMEMYGVGESLGPQLMAEKSGLYPEFCVNSALDVKQSKIFTRRHCNSRPPL